MNLNYAFYISTIVIVTLTTYVYSILTFRDKVFPYKVLREFKRFIIGNLSSKRSNRFKIVSQSIKYYLERISFIKVHGKKTQIVMLGDSLTQEAKWENLFNSKEIANHGIGGDTTADVLNRIELIYKINPTKVFIMIGINDLLKGNDIDDINRNYQKIVNILVKSNIKVYIQSILFVGNKRKHLNNKIITLNNMLENFSRTNELATYVDLNQALSNGSYLSEEYTKDDIHLKRKGYKVWRDIICQYIM